jgi:hypothetical protein
MMDENTFKEDGYKVLYAIVAQEDKRTGIASLAIKYFQRYSAYKKDAKYKLVFFSDKSDSLEKIPNIVPTVVAYSQDTPWTFHREDGPALIRLNDDGSEIGHVGDTITNYLFYINGKPIAEDRAKLSAAYASMEKQTFKSYFNMLILKGLNV